MYLIFQGISNKEYAYSYSLFGTHGLLSQPFETFLIMNLLIYPL